MHNPKKLTYVGKLLLLVTPEGFKPPTLGAEIRYSIQLSYGAKFGCKYNVYDVINNQRLVFLRNRISTFKYFDSWLPQQGLNLCVCR